MLIDIIAGVQADFIKVAPIIDAIQVGSEQHNITYRFVFTGQHKLLSAEFIVKLGIPYPHISLETGNGTEGEQTGTIMVRYEKVLLAEKPDMVLLAGDTNAIVACAITAKKNGNIAICRLDAGMRNNNPATHDEINRILTDAITDHFFTSSHIANEHLRRTGVHEERIFFVGNTLADNLVKYKTNFLPPPLWGKLNLQTQHYFIVALHKKENTELVKLKNTLIALIRSSQGLPIIMPAYPETVKTLENIGIRAPNLFITDFQDYFHFNHLMQNAKMVITDSGVIEEATTLMGVPCMTVGRETEQEETLLNGTNELIGTNPNNIPGALRKLFLSQWKRGLIPYLWDGNAGERIVNVFKNLSKQEPTFYSKD